LHEPGSDMMERDFNFNEEPLWAVPENLQARMLQGLGLGEDRSFQLSCLYSGLNVFFLCLFGIYAVTVGASELATLNFSLAAIMAAGFGFIWFFEWRQAAPHFTTTMMALMCLALFCNGGLQNTGPLWYFVFPTAALSMNGRLGGAIWVVSLLLVTLLLWNGVFGLELPAYENMYVSRIIGICLIITVLAAIPEYYRSRAERNLLLSWSDIEQMSFRDAVTGLANRSLLRKLLHTEFQRHQRYRSACSLMFLQADPVTSLLYGSTMQFDPVRLAALLGQVLKQNLRIQDFAGRWDDSSFLLLLPEINQEGAVQLAERLLDAVRAAGGELSTQPLRLQASIGIAAFDGRLLREVLHEAADQLLEAQRAGGNRYSVRANTQ
jgi:diguanylate cyclase (GGDEF)-like protein